MLFGAIADDLTGATDLSLTLSREGMRTIQTVGVPTSDLDLKEYDAVVVALKSRTNPAAEAVSMSLAALEWLQAAGAKQVLFKYCSTFDSTPHGNIGPVTDALFSRMKADLTVVCPAFPANRRTVYMGNLFVADKLLSESPMRNHPLTPMLDSSLVRLMSAQSKLKVGLIPYEDVAGGVEVLSRAYASARSKGTQVLVVDAISDSDLRVIGESLADFPLITGGSGIAIGLPDNFRRRGLLRDFGTAKAFTAPSGRAAILAGSCSEATRLQIKTALAAGVPGLKVEPRDIVSGATSVDKVVDWVLAQNVAGPLVYSSAEPNEVRASQLALGREHSGEVIEQFLARTSVELRKRGVRKLIVAGGETSGAVVSALAPPALHVGSEIDPGVPWTLTVGQTEAMALALKSGNFGSPDFFIKAWDFLK
ncbi:four-carbon acid sugar kinase family protein [Rhizobium vallis]|uniref:3-oxo-tetronate kinase n=1 Tax=Rhizobium vallis TaxID=634290 RepID=A0A432PIE4_9HYPH|nr:3-oxo-tetronate kinase [Rhizobium vallis]RUM24162.1 four-carbon acid sugar kinase family protein [Rhizobium vallis]